MRRVALVLGFLLIAVGRPAWSAGMIHRGDRMAIWTEHSLRKIPREASAEKLASMDDANAARLRVAANERGSFQIVVTPREKALSVENVAVSELTGPEDAAIGKEAVTVQQVGYIDKKHPDVLYPGIEDAKAVPGENWNLWVTVAVPADAAAGRYEGRLTLTIDGRKRAVPVAVHVWDFSLPERTHVETQLFTLGGGGGELTTFYEPREVKQVTVDAFKLYAERRLSSEVTTPKELHDRFPLPPTTAKGRRGDALGCRGGGLVLEKADGVGEVPSTVSVWVKPEAKEGHPVVLGERPFGAGVDQGGRVHLAVQPDQQRVKRVRWDLPLSDGKAVELSGGSFPTGEWHHLAAVRQRKKAALYVDGEEVASKQLSATPAATDGRVGLGTYGGVDAYPKKIWSDGYFYHGGLDEVRVYTRALSRDAIAKDMESKEPLDGVSFRRSFDTFDDSIDAVSGSLPKGHLLSRHARDYFFKWAEWWVDRGLSLGRLPFRRVDAERSRLFFKTYVAELRRRGWLDRTYLRLPGDEGFYEGTKRKIRNIRAGLLWNRLGPDVRTHMTFDGLYFRHSDEEQKLRTLRDFDRAVDIWSLYPAIYLPYERVTRFLRQRTPSWYIHHDMEIDQTALRNRLFFWRMWQEGVAACTLWSTTLWKRGDTETKRQPRGFTYDSRWFGNAVLFWPGEDGLLPSIRADLMRDGIEDWEMLRLLRERFRAADDEELGPSLYRKISYALDIPGNIVDRFRHATDDPKKLREHRRKVANLIETLAERTGRGEE